MTFVELSHLIQKNRIILDKLLQQGEVIYARNNSSGKVKKIRIRALYENDPDFWHKNSGAWQYYLDKETSEKFKRDLLSSEEDGIRTGGAQSQQSSGISNIQSESSQTNPTTEPVTSSSGLYRQHKSIDSVSPGPRSPDQPPEAKPNFGKEFQTIAQLSIDQRQERISQRIKTLQEIANDPTKDHEEAVKAMVDSGSDGAVINTVSIQEAMVMDDTLAKDFMERTVKNTEELIKSAARLIQVRPIMKDDMVSQLVQKSNGTVVQHMTRVFINAFTFLHYYNKQVTTSSIANKFRIKFSKQYKHYYRRLLPNLHEDNVTLERVFMGGMRALTEHEMNNFGVGFLIHDIGKVEDIEYHEGEASYDRERVVAHVKKGYQAVINKTSYSREAALITGYHHEYYGDPAGYGYFREFLNRYKQQNPKAQIQFCITYDMADVLDYKAFSYFPAKVLEIADVYDSFTDRNRRYRKPLTPEEALNMIREEFLEKYLKVDPILFDLFVSYLHEEVHC
jgi:HD-GYP domain-containing protein (c-di-GMP phosphodiesterase class II)